MGLISSDQCDASTRFYCYLLKTQTAAGSHYSCSTKVHLGKIQTTSAEQNEDEKQCFLSTYRTHVVLEQQ